MVHFPSTSDLINGLVINFLKNWLQGVFVWSRWLRRPGNWVKMAYKRTCQSRGNVLVSEAHALALEMVRPICRPKISAAENVGYACPSRERAQRALN